MRTLFNILLFPFIFFLLFCTSKRDKDNVNLPITKSLGVDTIHIDLDTISTSRSFKDLFSKIEIIQLPIIKNHFFNFTQEMVINEQNENNYVLLDTKELHFSFFCFDSMGNFIRKASLNLYEGKSYSILPDMWLVGNMNFVYNPFDSVYVFYDGDEIFEYDNKKLGFIKRTKLNFGDEDFIYFFFIPISKDLYAIYDTSPSGDGIYFYSQSKDSIINQQIIPQTFDVFRDYVSPFSSFNNHFFYLSIRFSNSIYEIHPDSLSVTQFFIMDYGKKTLTEDNINDFYRERNKTKNGKIIKTKDYAYLLNMLQNNQSYWFFSRFDGKIYISVCNKTTKEI